MLFLHGSFNRMSPVCNMTAIRCTVPNCSCDCFTPNKSNVRTCATCKHGWVAHALDKLGFRHLYNCNQVEIVQPSIVFDIASLMLYGCQATPIRLKILLDRLFSVLQHDEVLQVLNGFGWGYEDYARGYILQDTQGTVLDKWNLATRDEEPLILQQFLRFGETKAITQQILLQDNNERPEHVAQSGRSDSDIKRFIERTNRIVHPFYRHSDGFLHHHSKHHQPPPPSQQPPPPPPPPPPQQSLPQSQHQHHSQAQVHHHHHHPPPPPPPSQLPTNQSSSSTNHPSSNKTLNRHHSTGSISGHNLSPTGSSQSFGSPVNCTSPMSISPLNRLQNMQPYDYRRENRAGSPDIVRPPTEPQPSAFQLQSNKPPTPTPMSNSIHTGNSGAVSLNLVSIGCSSPTPPLHLSASLPTLGSSLAHSSNSSQIGNSDLSDSEGGSDDEDTMTSALNLSRSATHDSIYATKKVKHLRKSANPMKRRWNPNALGTLVSNTASGKKRVQCSVCLKTFCDKGALKIHFSAVHLREMHKCTVAGCNMMFSSRRSRNRHSANPNPKLHSPHLRRKISPHDGRTANANPGHYFLGHSLVPPPLGPLQLDTHLSPHHHSHHHHHHQMLPLPGGIALPPPSLSHSNNEFRHHHHHHRDIKREEIISNSRTPSPSRESPSIDNLISVPSRSPSPIPTNDFKEVNDNHTNHHHHHHHHHHHQKNKVENENKKPHSNNNNNEEHADEIENRSEMDVDGHKQNSSEPQTAPVELRKLRETPENDQLNNKHESAVSDDIEKNKSPDIVTTTTAPTTNSINAPREAEHDQQQRISHQIKKGVRKRKSLNPTRCAISEVEDAIQFVSSEDSSSNDTFLQNNSIDNNGTEKSDEFKDDDKTDDDDDDDLLDDDDKEMDFDDDDDDDMDDDVSIKLNNCQSLIPLNKIKKELRGSFSSNIRAAREKLFRLDDVTREEINLKKFKKSASEGDEAEENSEMALRHLESLSQGHFGDPSQFSLRSGGGHIPSSLHLPLGSSATSNAHGLHPGTSDVYSDASPRLQDSTISGNAHGGGGGGSGGSNPDSPLSETQSFSFRDTGLMNCFDVPVDKDNPRRCPTCGKIFQNHFGVKTHYQNVHLKLMHKCTVEGCNAAFPSKRSRDRHSANLNLHRKLLSTTEKNFLDKSLAFASLAANQTLRDEFLSRIYGETPGVLPLAINELYQSKLSASMSESLIHHHHHHHNNNNDRAVPNSNHFGSHHPLSLHSAGLLLPSAAAIAAANETSAHLDLGFHLKNAQSRPSPSSLHHSPLNASPPSPPSVHSSGGGSGAFNSMTHNFVYSLEDDLPSPDSNGNFPCKFCHKRFQDGVLLKDHYEKIHLPEMFRCTVNGCNKIFSSQKKRNQHSQNSGVHKHLSTSPTSPDS